MTSDSDFTPLVLRILESGFPVYGFGAKKTFKPFVDSCSPFIYIENLMSVEADKEDAVVAPPKRSKAQLRKNTSLVRLLRTAVEQTVGDDGWANMGAVASYISNNNSSFSSINYGYRKISDLIKATNLFKVEMRNGTAMYIRGSRSKLKRGKGIFWAGRVELLGRTYAELGWWQYRANCQ